MPPHHPIMLCQPDRRKSCAACCGLYNWTDHSRAAITAIVTLQTDLFLDGDTRPDMHTYRQARDAAITNTKLFETIYNCEFVGFIDPHRRRVGCMLHPAVTGDPRLRDHCFYGTEICNSHFCPGFSCLTTAEQRCVVAAVDDWYLYGLIITDIDLVKEFFRHAENRLGDSIKPARLEQPGIRQALADFFRFKETWPFKARENRLGKYYFSQAEYAIARIEYGRRWGIPPSVYDKILVSLESEFANRDELRQAEQLVETALCRFLDAYTGSTPAVAETPAAAHNI